MQTKLSVIIPVFNEEKTLMNILDRVLKVPLKKIQKEIIIVDDCSVDKTKDILNKIKNNKIKIFFHQKNQGKGAAIRTGLKNSTGDIILIQDADLEYSPEEYPKLIQPILDKKTKVVYGSRLIDIKKHKKNMYWLHYLGNWFLTSITNILYNSRITDMETCYKVFTKDVIKKIKLRARRFDFEPEITSKILKKRYKIYEVPIEFNARRFDEGKKITWIDGIKALFYLIRYRFFD